MTNPFSGVNRSIDPFLLLNDDGLVSRSATWFRPRSREDIELREAEACPRAFFLGRERAITMNGRRRLISFRLSDDEYFRRVRAWCDEQGLLLILDEVQTGIGRTGVMFAYQHFGIEPDIITLAKGLGGGFPIGAVLVKEHCSVFVPGDHGTTFGGNPLATAVGCAVVKFVLDKDMCGKAARAGEMLGRKLFELEDRFDFVTAVRGKGLLWGIEFEREMAEEVTLACLEAGLMVNNVRPNVLRLSPPLTISDTELEKGLAILQNVLSAGYELEKVSERAFEREWVSKENGASEDV